MGTIKAVCTSAIKGIQKTETDSVELQPDWGIENDAHAGKWHRQVSLLAYEQIEDFKSRGADVINGAFGENIIVEGFDLSPFPSERAFSRATWCSSSRKSARNVIPIAPSITRWAIASCRAKACFVR